MDLSLIVTLVQRGVAAFSKVPKDWVTERDGTSFCIVRFIGTIAAALILWKFYSTSGAPDYNGFAVAIGAIGAIIIGKQFSEKE